MIEQFKNKVAAGAMGDIKKDAELAEYLLQEVSSGRMTINQARIACGLEPIETLHADSYLVAAGTAISSNNLDTKDLHCISKHLFSFYEDAKNKETANFAKPCIDCKFALDKTCSLDWFPTFQRLSILTGVVFSMRKDRLEPVIIMDIVHRNPSDYN
ncbi:hypothetical protein [Paenibacillus elgii]|uniref:hypothetical protein n=1 Tax=Paenibacillus elgii TaxID=189691 RepID=UPI000248D3AC|nr:hypothetical protein [Paenibacillus elgii]